jgi:hypothetical protein
MDLEAWLGAAPAVALAVALAACTGLRAWLPLLLTGIVARSGFLELGPSFQFLASDRALAVLGLATVLEIAADKIPVVDHVLDSLSVVIRPAAGSLVAASVLWPVADPFTAMALGTAIGAPSSLVPHAAKSALRAASTAFTGGLANPVLSLLEDAAAFALFVLAVVVPVVVALALVAVAILLARRLARGTRAAVRAT